MAPLSEIYGRKPVSVASLVIFNIMIIPCAVTHSIAVLIVFRFIGAFAGSVMISSAPGMVADLVPHKNRALAFSVWSLGPINGPGMYYFHSLISLLLKLISQFLVPLSAVSYLNISAGGGHAGSV